MFRTRIILTCPVKLVYVKKVPKSFENWYNYCSLQPDKSFEGWGKITEGLFKYYSYWYFSISVIISTAETSYVPN